MSRRCRRNEYLLYAVTIGFLISVVAMLQQDMNKVPCKNVETHRIRLKRQTATTIWHGDKRIVSPSPKNFSGNSSRRDILPKKIVHTSRNLSRVFIETRVRINVRRRQILNAHCDEHSSLLDVAIGKEALRHLYVNDIHNLLYCSVPLAGSTNWKGIMMVLAGNSKRFEELTSDEIQFKNGLRTLASYPYEEQKYILETYTKFIYVRHPFIRLLSAYKSVFENHKKFSGMPNMQHIATKILILAGKNVTIDELRQGTARITWEDFAAFLAGEGGASSDDLFENTNNLCAPCQVQYDYIGKVETIHNDSAVMFRELNLELIVAYPTRDNRPTDSESAYEASFSTLPRDIVSRLWHVYKHDFGMFGYDAPNFLPFSLP